MSSDRGVKQAGRQTDRQTDRHWLTQVSIRRQTHGVVLLLADTAGWHSPQDWRWPTPARGIEGGRQGRQGGEEERKGAEQEAERNRRNSIISHPKTFLFSLKKHFTLLPDIEWNV